MEREANYAAVGAFVLLVITLASLFIYWYADSRDARDYERYEIYFDGSVSGLTRGGTVRYLGVDVGRVVNLRIDPRAATRVQVIADIDSSAPIGDETVAELSLQGVTGLLYIDLLGRRGSKSLTPTVPSDRYPVIRSVRSNFDAFVSGLPEMVARAGEVARRLSRVMSDENIASLSRTVANVEQASAVVAPTMREVEALVRELRVTTRDVGLIAADLRVVTAEAGPEMRAAIGRVRAVADNLASTTASLDRFMASSEDDLRSFTRDALPELERLLRESRDAARQFEALSRSLSDNPSQLIYQPAASGVELPR